MKITAITLQSKNIDRANLFLDGKFYAGVSRIAIYNHKLEIGKEISQTELDKLISKTKLDIYKMNILPANWKELYDKILSL